MSGSTALCVCISPDVMSYFHISPDVKSSLYIYIYILMSGATALSLSLSLSLYILMSGAVISLQSNAANCSHVRVDETPTIVHSTT